MEIRFVGANRQGRLFEFGAEVAGGVGGFALCNLFGGAFGYERAAGGTTFRAEVDDVVGALDYVDVVLDDYYRVSARYEAVERVHQQVDVVEMEASGGFVENKHCRLGFLHGQEIGELHALVLTP